VIYTIIPAGNICIDHVIGMNYRAYVGFKDQIHGEVLIRIMK